MYEFDETGKMIIKNGFVEENGEIYYYIEGVKWTRRGVFKVDGDYYYAKTGGALVRSQKIYATVTNDLVPFDMYEFDETGKMIIKNGFVEEDGEIYYYVDGVKWTRRGVFKVGDDFYYAKTGGALLRNTTAWASVTNDLLPKAQYQFDENGKILIK
jgi:glucan-binding YG repeat protein